jgi:hypothetical protein
MQRPHLEGFCALLASNGAWPGGAGACFQTLLSKFKNRAFAIPNASTWWSCRGFVLTNHPDGLDVLDHGDHAFGRTNRGDERYDGLSFAVPPFQAHRKPKSKAILLVFFWPAAIVVRFLRRRDMSRRADVQNSS